MDAGGAGDAARPEVVSVLGSVLDAGLVERTITGNGVQTIYHAAAYKHVPIVEHNPVAGLRNNTFGTATLANVAARLGVERVTLISTDKAVRPTNVMGASKRLAELIFQAYAAEADGNTVFTMVRFGNVLGSSGSVVPRFMKQIRDGGPVTVTDPEVTRYFMSISEAAGLVVQASAMARGGEVFVLDMGECVKIDDLARMMIRLMNRRVLDEDNPDGDIEIKYVGMRHGEKRLRGAADRRPDERDRASEHQPEQRAVSGEGGPGARAGGARGGDDSGADGCHRCHPDANGGRLPARCSASRAAMRRRRGRRCRARCIEVADAQLSALLEVAVDVRRAQPDEGVGEAAVAVDPGSDVRRIGAAQGLGGCRQAGEMEAERGLGRYTDAVARDMPEQDGAGGLTWADNSNADAARRMPRPASVVVGDPSTVVVINVDGLGCCGCA